MGDRRSLAGLAVILGLAFVALAPSQEVRVAALSVQAVASR